MNVRLAIGSALAAIAVLSGTAAVAAAHSDDGPAASRQLAALRASTASFHSIAIAEQHGYALLTDAKGIACIDMPGMGGMGVHWANSKLVGNAAIVANSPEALVYAPTRDGTLQLAAVEYVVIKAAWDATHHKPPRLFGQEFNFTPAPNRYGLPPFYSLHVWVWKHNPAGMFTMWNPKVTCRA